MAACRLVIPDFAMLHETLERCKALELDGVMVCCLADNEASRRTLLKNGSVYEYTIHEPDEDVDIERYWMTL